MRIDELGCRSDSTEIRYGGAEASFTLAADRARLPVLETAFDTESGIGSVVAYPVLKTQSVVRISVKDTEPIEVPLP